MNETTHPPTNRFNEAAADDRGKPDEDARLLKVFPASMRPRPMTAENSVSSLRTLPVLGSLQ